jgi:hypothetical protein
LTPKLAFTLAVFAAVSSAATLQTATQLGLYDTNGNGLAGGCYSTNSNCSGAYSFAGSTANYSTFSSADYGILKSAGSVSISRPAGPAGSGGPYQISAFAVSRFEDQWTIGGATPGTTGHLTLQFSITGDYGNSGVGTGYSYGLYLRTFTPFHDSTDNQLPSYTGSVSADFTFGTALDFEVGLIAGGNLYNLQNGGTNGQFAFLDMSHTAMISGATVTDANGNVIPFTLQTASNSANFQGLGAAAATPEPSTFVLLAGAGLTFAMFRKRTLAK